MKSNFLFSPSFFCEGGGFFGRGRRGGLYEGRNGGGSVSYSVICQDGGCHIMRRKEETLSTKDNVGNCATFSKIENLIKYDPVSLRSLKFDLQRFFLKICSTSSLCEGKNPTTLVSIPFSPSPFPVYVLGSISSRSPSQESKIKMGCLLLFTY